MIGRTSTEASLAAGMDGGPLERLVQIGAFDDGVPAELLLDLRRGAVGEDRLAVADPHRRRGGPVRQRGAVDEHPGPAQASSAAPYAWVIWSASAVPGSGSASVVRLSRNMYFTVRTSYVGAGRYWPTD